MLADAQEAVTELGAAPTLPRTSAALSRALNALYARSAPLAFTLAGQPWQFRWRCRDACTSAAATCQSYRFRIGPHSGRLALDALAVAALIGERRSELLPRELRYVLLADALHPLSQALEKTLHLHFEWAPPAAGESGTAAADAAPHGAAWFAMEAAGIEHGGHLLFDDDATLGALLAAMTLPPPAAPRSQALDWLRIPLPFVLGHTQISLREIGSIQRGDIVGIGDWGSSGAALLVTAELGGPAGRRLIGLAEGSRITLQQSKEIAMNRDIPAAEMAADADDAASLPLDRLDALEVSLRFEVGELSLSLGELKGLRAGHVFELAHPLNRSPVRIVAHGNVLGRGYLVAVGDQLGVRVSEFAPSEL